MTNTAIISVLVPFPGFLYLYEYDDSHVGALYSSRPLPGVLISLQQQKNWIVLSKMVLVPFPGFLYLYTFDEILQSLDLDVLVPFPGFLYLYCKAECLQAALDWFSSPSRGSYISTLSSQSLELYTHISAFAAQM